MCRALRLDALYLRVLGGGWLVRLDESSLFSAKRWRDAKIHAQIGVDKSFVINE
jgi:hypothetical protein